jgi:ankyrin repeat protein
VSSHCKYGAVRNHLQVLKMLLGNPKTQLGPVDVQGHTPLWYAMVMGDHTIAAMLRAKGAPVQLDIASQLCKAAALNNVKFIELLLMHNVHVLARVCNLPQSS